MAEKRPPYADALGDMLEPWMRRLSELDEASGRAWDERVRRIAARTATTDDQRTQAAAEAALKAGRPLPAAARKMPGPELPPSQRTWHPDVISETERAIALGIPPLIAAEIVDGAGRETRSTKACDGVGRTCLILVLIGAPGCGKTYAAARWLWRARTSWVPDAIARRVTASRFIEAPALADVEFADRPKLGLARALVVDDLGTEKDFLQGEWARLFVMRYASGLATVITTNLSQQDFEKTYGERVADRMRETGRFVVVSNDARDSLRGKG